MIRLLAVVCLCCKIYISLYIDHIAYTIFLLFFGLCLVQGDNWAWKVMENSKGHGKSW